MKTNYFVNPSFLKIGRIGGTTHTPKYGYGIRTRPVPVTIYGNGNGTYTGRFSNWEYGLVMGTDGFSKSGDGYGT